jgi:hypothetical protein
MKRIVRLTESDLARIVRRVINERQYLMEGLGNTTLELVTGPAAINRTVCSTGMDQFLVTLTVKNTGTEIAYLTRVAVGGKGLTNAQLADHKVSIGGVSKHSNHDNGAEQAIVPVGKTATVTVIAKTNLYSRTAKISDVYKQIQAERNPTKKTELQNQLAALRKESPFGSNQVYIEYNGGKINVPLDTAGLVLGNTTCEAAIDLARGF